MKKILLPSIISLLSFSVSAQQFTLKLSDTNLIKNVIVDSPYNSSGFHNSTGLHKDTGTEYDPDGFNQNGYGQETCLSYNEHTQAVEEIIYPTYSIYSFKWNGTQTNRQGNTLSTINGHEKAYQDSSYLYYPGDVTSMYHNPNNNSDYTFYRICRKAVKPA